MQRISVVLSLYLNALFCWSVKNTFYGINKMSHLASIKITFVNKIDEKASDVPRKMCFKLGHREHYVFPI